MIKYLIENLDNGKVEVTIFDYSAEQLGVINVFDTMEEAAKYMFLLDGRGLQVDVIKGVGGE